MRHRGVRARIGAENFFISITTTLPGFEPRVRAVPRSFSLGWMEQAPHMLAFLPTYTV